MLFYKRLVLVAMFISQGVFSVPPQQQAPSESQLSARSVKNTLRAMPRGTGFALLAACVLVGYGIYRLNQQDELFYPGLCGVQKVVHEALVSNSFDQKRLEKALVSLQKDCGYVEAVTESGAAPSKKLTKMLDKSAQLYRTVYDEVGALDLWVQGYEAYEKDLADNFKSLPNGYVQKPDFKRLYEELGVSTENGKEFSWDKVHKSYNERYSALKALDIVAEDFEQYCFRPYLRVLQLVFRSEAQKRQYDAYLRGKEFYEEKSEALKDTAPFIRELFASQLPRVNQSIELLKAEFSQLKQKQD